MATKKPTAKSRKNDYSRFYALLRQHPMADKEDLVYSYTGGRTTHVSDMRKDEFQRMCNSLQYGSEGEQRVRELSLKKARSSALLRIGRLGISTIDNWDGINAFVESPKIAGKRFYDLSIDELQALVSKLESILRKGGLKKTEESGQKPAQLQDSQIAAFIQIAQSNNRKHLN